MSPRTYEAYELALRRHVLPVFGSRQVRGITVDQLVDWIRDMRCAGYAPHSVHNYWAPINLVMRFAVRRGALASNPADQLTSAERPKPGLGRRRFLDKHEMERLLNAATDRYRVAIACGLFAGVWLSELLGLVWDAIDFRGETIRVRFQMGRDGKRRPLKTAAARRDVILMKPLASELLRLRVASPFSGPGDLVFCSTMGATVGHRNLTARGLEKAAIRSGVDRRDVPRLCRPPRYAEISCYGRRSACPHAVSAFRGVRGRHNSRPLGVDHESVAGVYP